MPDTRHARNSWKNSLSPQMEYEQKGAENFTLDASSKCHLWDLPHRCAQWHPYHPYNPFKLPNLVPVKGLLGMGCSLHLASIVQRFCRKDPITLYTKCVFVWRVTLQSIQLLCNVLDPKFLPCMGCTLYHLASGLYPYYLLSNIWNLFQSTLFTESLYEVAQRFGSFFNLCHKLADMKGGMRFFQKQ